MKCRRVLRRCSRKATVAGTSPRSACKLKRDSSQPPNRGQLAVVAKRNGLSGNAQGRSERARAPPPGPDGKAHRTPVRWLLGASSATTIERVPG